MITKMITKDDDKGDDKKLKGQSKNEFKIESRILQDSRGKLISRLKRFKISRIKIKIQDSRFKNEEKTQSR